MDCIKVTIGHNRLIFTHKNYATATIYASQWLPPQFKALHPCKHDIEYPVKGVSVDITNREESCVISPNFRKRQCNLPFFDQ